MTNLYEALDSLKKAKWINLAQEVTDNIPHFPIFNPLFVKTLSTVENDGYLCQEVTIGTQYGTHIDAPFHFVNGRINLQQIDLKDKFLPLVVLHFEEVVFENPDFELTVEHILEHEAVYGEIPKGSFVALATGWAKRFDDALAFYNADESGVEHTPGWTVEALRFLHEERDVTAIGHETINTDSGISIAKNGRLDAEYYWLDKNKYQIEVLTNLDQVPARGSLIKIGYPNIQGLSGFTVDVVAIVNE